MGKRAGIYLIKKKLSMGKLVMRISNLVRSVFILCFLVLGNPFNEVHAGKDMNWSDDYKKMIENASISKNADFRNDMVESMWNWKNLDDYKKIHGLYTKEYESKLENSIRLEIGNANEGSYDFIWLFDTGGKRIIIYSNLNNHEDGLALERKEISRDEFNTLLKKIKQFDILKIRSNAQIPAEDGSSYFVSFFNEGKSHQFAIYAPLFPPSSILKNKEWQKLYNKTKKQSEIIELLLKLVRE